MACALYAGLVVLALAHQIGGQGALASPSALLADLGATPTDPWGLGEHAPHSYRPLFRALVLAASRLTDGAPEAFYGVFVAASGMALLAGAAAMDVLLRELRFSGRQALLGTSLFLTGFPIVFSHDAPIGTREDLLGYAWIALTLAAVARDRPLLVAALGVVGATISEACLLGVLPLALVSRRPLAERLLAYGPPLLALVGVHLVQAAPGEPAFDLLGSSTRPSFDVPLEAPLYAFLALGWVWVGAGARLLDPTPPRHPLLAPRVALLLLAATVGVGWTLGRVREARITYVLAPLAVPLALDLAASGRLRALARAPAAWAAAGLVLALGLGGLAWVAGSEVRLGRLQDLIGDAFNPGVVPTVDVSTGTGEVLTIDPTDASPLGGPFALGHVALAAGLAAGWVARGRRRGALALRAPGG